MVGGILRITWLASLVALSTLPACLFTDPICDPTGVEVTIIQPEVGSTLHPPLELEGQVVSTQPGDFPVLSAQWSVSPGPTGPSYERPDETLFHWSVPDPGYGSVDIYLSGTNYCGSQTAIVPATVLPLPPVVEIFAPSDGAVFIEGELIDFEGTVAVDDPVLELELTWQSDLDGPLGDPFLVFGTFTGGPMPPSQVLSPGVHTVTLRADVVESDLLAWDIHAEDSIMVEVVPGSS